VEEVDLIQSRLQDNPLLRYAALALLAAGLGALGGLVIVAGGNPLVPFVALVGLVAPPLRWLYDYAWFVGFAVAGAVYFVSMKRERSDAAVRPESQLADEERPAHID
jgi:cytosine/uracil/thiamine/allantoin permease